MLDIPIASGRTPAIPPEIKEKLINELNEREGLSTYKEIPTWLYTVHDLKVSYKVVQDTVRYRLKGKLLVMQIKRLIQILYFKKTAGNNLKKLLLHKEKQGLYRQVIPFSFKIGTVERSEVSRSR